MEENEILENLCCYDTRNPFKIEVEEDEKPKGKCFCDNCFYGRSKLANEILKLKGK